MMLQVWRSQDDDVRGGKEVGLYRVTHNLCPIYSNNGKQIIGLGLFGKDYKDETSALIEAWEMKIEIMTDKPTDRLTNCPTDQQTSRHRRT